MPRNFLSHTHYPRNPLLFKQLEVGHTVLLLRYTCTGGGEVFTWGWSECVPSIQPTPDESEQVQGDDASACAPSTSLQSSPRNNAGASHTKPSSHAPPLRNSGALPGKQSGRQTHRNLTCKTTDSKGAEEILKKRKIVSFEHGESPESPTAAEENVFAPPCLVNLDPGIRISIVAAGGRHTLALSDVGHVWGWGYGGEGQLGLGTRMRIVSSPQLIPCFNSPENGISSSGAPIPGSSIKAIACGGRHSAIVTDAGALLTFGWGLYGQQVGQGSNEDELSPCLVSAMGGLQVTGIAAGLWHTLCITDIGDVYAFGGNQFGQLGVGGNSAEMSPRLIDAPLLEDESCVAVACGARHSVVLTGSGKIFAWGWNKYGQLGLGDNNNRDLPVQVTMNDGGRAANIACGWWHTLATVHIK
ncbi:ultraviolet-B receptor UVR8 isoform X3 [Physcomitrium patens]|uniref:ultraviolet-B receptor UVR8 isoform X3 n=1 Tax=Physcomitrium patens TaxID=3218 RepID=UPI000D164813|nr:ultraviolet-B receptor UVR8-like isoform X3 [Physcomitrium patens]XP_024357887.1 ultraviolet-B receptor UVR8-like isoform X3 [Physcomitrium patens]XP_024357888.1 ultraviolet-B receptor UVR8-like isoform X3 [Physcomitrium patens]XP_024357889.1 ultraviolet-B receptor UVR8-like isoform X3 [Physcomitrium patens]|eukprot:XP_024357886.1 ultraviolet-B receptor UVR8-like isoform X3 [Physcomitrella patens]